MRRNFRGLRLAFRAKKGAVHFSFQLPCLENESLQACFNQDGVSRHPQKLPYFRFFSTQRECCPALRSPSLATCADVYVLSCEKDVGKDGCLHGGQGRRRNDLRAGECHLGGHLRLDAGEQRIYVLPLIARDFRLFSSVSYAETPTNAHHRSC